MNCSQVVVVIAEHVIINYLTYISSCVNYILLEYSFDDHSGNVVAIFSIFPYIVLHGFTYQTSGVSYRGI